MIKAKELVWSLIELYGFTRSLADAGFGFAYIIIKHKSDFYATFEKEVCDGYDEIDIVGYKPKTLEEARAACQAHYQQMVESMVDMGHFKRTTEEAIEFGFDAAQGRLWAGDPVYEQDAKMAAKVAFLKTLEQKGEG